MMELMSRSRRAMTAEKKAEADPPGTAGHGEGSAFCSKTNGSQWKMLSSDKWYEEN